MRTTDERMTDVLSRAKKIKKIRKKNCERIAILSSVVASFILIITLGVFMPSLMVDIVNGTNIDAGFAASIFKQGSAIGYVFVGVVAFLLGISVTILCVFLNKHNKEGKGEGNNG